MAILITIHKDYIFPSFISTVRAVVPRRNVNITHRVNFQCSSPALSRDRPSFPCVCQYGLKPTLFFSEDKCNRVSPVWRRAHVVSDFLPLFAEQRNRVGGEKDRFSSARRRLVRRHGLNIGTRCENCQFVRVWGKRNPGMALLKNPKLCDF